LVTDAAGNRHYILVALTKHPQGDDYLVELAKQVDDALTQPPPAAAAK